MRYLILALKGTLVGAANVIPGVSGGTIAVVLGIFDTLIESVNHLFKNVKKSLQFLIPIGIGAVVGIIVLGTLIDYCLRNFSFQTSLFFVGLVVGSIPLIYKKSTAKTYRPSLFIVTVVAALVVIAMSLLKTPAEPYMETAVSVGFMTKLFLGGAVAAMAMVVPGISGSFIFVLLGLYPTIIHTIALVKDYLLSPTNFALLPPILAVVIPCGVGVLLGIVLISKLIAFLLEKYYSITYFAILGLMLGTVFGIFNDPLTYQSYTAGLSAPVIGIGLVTCVLGTLTAFYLGKE